jgi:addiction module RelE/StbE family toxin
MVKWSNSAKYDLRQIYDYISKDSKIYGKKVIDDIVSRADQLNQFSNLGRKVTELHNPRVREIMIYSYRLIYEVKSDEEVEVLAIIHTKRKFILTDND